MSNLFGVIPKQLICAAKLHNFLVVAQSISPRNAQLHHLFPGESKLSHSLVIAIFKSIYTYLLSVIEIIL